MSLLFHLPFLPRSNRYIVILLLVLKILILINVVKPISIAILIKSNLHANIIRWEEKKRTRNDTDGHHFFIYFLKLDTDTERKLQGKKKKKQYINRQDVVKLQVNLLLVLCVSWQ